MDDVGREIANQAHLLKQLILNYCQERALINKELRNPENIDEKNGHLLVELVSVEFSIQRSMDELRKLYAIKN